MPNALPSPYVDSGDTASFTISGAVALNASGNGSIVGLGLRGSLINDLSQTNYWRLFEVYHQVGPDFISDLYVTEPDSPFFPATPVLLDTINHGPTPPPANTFFAPQSFSATIGPCRLGWRFNLSTGGGPVLAPTGLADENTLASGWFLDDASFYDEDVGGELQTVPAGAPTPHIQVGAIGIFTVRGGPSPPGVGVPIAKFTGVLINGDLIDTDGIDLAPVLAISYEGVAPGDFNLTDLTTAGLEILMAPGVEIIYSNTMLDYAGAAASPDLTDNWLTPHETFRAGFKTPYQPNLSNGTYTAPFGTNYPRATKDVPASINIAIDPAWLAANGHDPEDLTVVLDQHSPINGDPTYSPIQITQEENIEIDRPTGGRPSSWTINSGANGSVTENVGDTVFVVTNTAARFLRIYATNWRNYTTNRLAPEWAIDGYTYQRRHYIGATQTVYPEDYWWWNSYMFLKLSVTATAAATMTLLVAGIDLGVSDNHSAIPGVRSSGLGFAENADTRTYVADVPIGTNDVWIDLSFPDAYIATGGATFPMRRPRVENLALSFDTVGTYTLNSMELSRRDAYATEVSVAYPPQSSYNAEWPGVYLRVDGEATPILTYGDTRQKGMEADLGGAIRFAEPEVGSIATAFQMWGQLLRIEGFTVVYADGARATFMEDVFGRALVVQGTEPSQFAVEAAPGDVFVGVGDAHGYTPLHCIRVGAVGLVNGWSFTIRGRHVFGGGVEGVAMDAGTRAGAGLTFDLVDQANTTLGSVVSDTRGRIHFEPIGFGKIVRFVPT